MDQNDTDTVQLQNDDGPVVYDGTDDSVLPEHIQSLLTAFAGVPEQADELRQELIGKTVAEIQAEFPPAPKGLSMGVPPFLEAQQHQDPEELWAHAKAEIEHIAEMFKTLADAGMPAEMAMQLIQERIPGAFLSPPSRGIQTAGARIEQITTPFGVQMGSHYGATIVSPFGNGQSR